MRKALALLAVFLLLPCGFLPGATRKKPAAKKGTTSKTTAQKRPATAGKKSASKKSSTKRRTASRKGQTWRTRQLQPTPERYREIQQALTQKGYLSGPVTGTWNQESISALSRFQQDQNLEPTGKIDSLSLIALGLGPKRETAAAVPPVRLQSSPATPNP